MLPDLNNGTTLAILHLCENIPNKNALSKITQDRSYNIRGNFQEIWWNVIVSNRLCANLKN